MGEVTYRSLKSRERSELMGYLSPWIWAFRAVLFAIAVAVIAWASHALENALLPASMPRLVWLLPTAVFSAWLYARARRWTGGAEFRDKVRRDIREGVVRKLHVTVAAAVEFEESGDSGPTFVVTTASGETLLFSGQDYARRKAKGFPWREFEVLDAPNSTIVFGLNRLGEPFKDVARRAPLTYEQARNLGCFQKSFASLPPDWETRLGAYGTTR
jgi:hypothetical protein